MASANYKLSNLVLPGSEDVYEIDAVYFGGKTAAEWQASTMSFKGTATIPYTSGQPTSTIVLEKTGSEYLVPASLNPVVGDSYKIILKNATDSAVIMRASATDSSKGSFSISHGDMIIYTADQVWVDIPSGNDENVGTVTSVSAGDGLSGGPITSSGALSVNFGRVAKLQHTHDVTGTTSAPTASFAGTAKDLTFNFTPAGSVGITSEQVTSGGNYTPNGTISSVTFLKSVDVAAPTFTGTQATISTSYKPAGSVSVSTEESEGDGNYTPTGSISTPEFTGNAQTIKMNYQKTSSVDAHNYTPAGSVSATFAGTKDVISVDYQKATGITGATYTPAGSVNATFAGTKATISGTPTITGTVSDQTVTVDQQTLSHTVTVEKQTISVPVSGSITTTKPDITVTPTEKTVVTGVEVITGTAPSMTAASFAHAYTANTKTLKVSYTPASFSAGDAHVKDIKVTTGQALSAIAAELADAPTASYTTTSSIEVQPTVTVAEHKFTPNASVSKATWTQATGTFSTEYTPAGTITAGFNGTQATITPTLTSTTATTSTEYIPAGTITADFNGTAATLSHAVKYSGTEISTSYTPTGTITTPAFTGTPVDISAGFSGTTATISTTYTPAGTITAPVVTPTSDTVTPTFTGKLAKLSASFTGSAGSSTVRHTPEGTVTVGTATVTGQTTNVANADN